MKDETYWHNKHPAQPIIYGGRRLPTGEPYQEDVRHFLCDRDRGIDSLVAQLGIRNLTRQDERAWACQRWVCDFIRYVSDGRFRVAEWWLYPWETFALRTGDCEDGANLLGSMMLIAGVDRWRVRVCAGTVVADQATAGTGGHAWVSYIRESDGEVMYLDWCYYADPLVHIADKPLGNTRDQYFRGDRVWWSYTIDETYAHQATNVFGRVRHDGRL